MKWRIKNLKLSFLRAWSQIVTGIFSHRHLGAARNESGSKDADDDAKAFKRLRIHATRRFAWKAIRAFLQEIYDASSVDALDTEYYDFVTRDKR